MNEADATGEYRVLPGPEHTGGAGWRLLDRERYETVTVAPEGHDAPVADLRAGYLVEASLDLQGIEPRVTRLSLSRPTLYAFADGIDPVFEAAEEAWRDARAAGGMEGRVTRNTDGAVNGVLYVFADGGVGNRFAEFRDGSRPVEPLVDRLVDRDGPAPRELFVLRPAGDPFVVVTITRRKGSRFANTMRETYDCPRPSEPLVTE
ncbi:MAG: DUF6663 family protein [Salinirussus sp.]